MQEHTEIVDPTPTRGSAQLASTPMPAVAAAHTTATSYHPYPGRRAGSIRLAQAVYLLVGRRDLAAHSIRATRAWRERRSRICLAYLRGYGFPWLLPSSRCSARRRSPVLQHSSCTRRLRANGAYTSAEFRAGRGVATTETEKESSVMIKIERTITIHRPVNEVFAYLCDIEHGPQYTSGQPSRA
jgi:hypothetical protein